MADLSTRVIGIEPKTGRYIVSLLNIPFVLKRGGHQLETSIVRNTFQNLNTGNEFLDDYLREVIQNRKKIKPCYQVISDYEIGLIKSKEATLRVQNVIRRRLKNEGKCVFTYMHGVTIDIISPSATPCSYFSQIEEYLIAISRNNYKS